MYRLSQPTLLNAYGPVKGRLDRLLTAGFLSRLFAAALPSGDGEEGGFLLLRRLFDALSIGVSPRLCGLWGQGELLQLLGYNPHFDGCVGCGANEWERFSALQGGLLCSRCEPGDGFLIEEAAVRFGRAVQCTSLEELAEPAERSAWRGLGLAYKAQFQVHLELPGDLFKRVLPHRQEKA